MANDLQEFIRNSPFQGGPQIPSKTPGGALIAKVIVAIVVLVIVGTGVSLATRIWDPLWSPFRPGPEKVMTRMYKNMEEIESFHVEGAGEIKEISSDDEKTELVVKGSADIDASNLDDIKAKSKSELTFVESGISFTVTIEFVLTDREVFFKIENIPPIPGMDFSSIEGQWFVMEDLSERDKEEEEKSFSEVFEEMLIFDRELKDEKLNGKKVYHYVFKLNQEKLKEGMGDSAAVADILIPREQSIEEDIEQWKDFEIHFFIGKKDELLYKVSFHEELEDEGIKADVSYEIAFSDFGQQIHIDIPRGAKSFEKLMESLFGGFMQTMVGPGAVPGPGFQQGDYRFLEREGIRNAIEGIIPFFTR